MFPCIPTFPLTFLCYSFWRLVDDVIVILFAPVHIRPVVFQEDFVKNLFSESAPKVNYVASKGVEQWRSLAIKALQLTGQYSAANLNSLLYQMQTESSGNPNAINLWDSNAKRGTPSKGLMQVIDPTFRAYAMAPYNKNIWDPLSNMIASIRYAVSRNGRLGRA